MIKAGEVFTVAGVNPMMRNPARRWWQLWKPKFVKDTRSLQQFRVI